MEYSPINGVQLGEWSDLFLEELDLQPTLFQQFMGESGAQIEDGLKHREDIYRKIWNDYNATMHKLGIYCWDLLGLPLFCDDVEHLSQGFTRSFGHWNADYICRLILWTIQHWSIPSTRNIGWSFQFSTGFEPSHFEANWAHENGLRPDFNRTSGQQWNFTKQIQTAKWLLLSWYKCWFSVRP